MKKPSPKRAPAKGPSARERKLAAIKAESGRALDDMIRRLLAKPMEQRAHFLRKKIGYRATCL